MNSIVDMLFQVDIDRRENVVRPTMNKLSTMLLQVVIDRREQCCAAHYEQVVNHVVAS
jgi:hypothetical protein